jgi:hypothetical protein
MKTKRLLSALALAYALSCAPAFAQTQCPKPKENETFSSTLALHQRFVQTYKDKALVRTNFNVDRYPPDGPHPIGRSGNDGDIHVAGRDSVVKLPFVAEIMNPRYFKSLSEATKAYDFMEELGATSSEEPVTIEGVWRLWFEHPAKTQVMGSRVPVPDDTSPPHVFEVHPVTKFGKIDTLPSFIPIKGYKKDFEGELKSYEAHSGEVTIPYYECQRSTITAETLDDGKAGIVIASRKSQYNYTDLVIKLDGKAVDHDDCFTVLAHVYDSFEQEERYTIQPRRMIFVKGSPPAEEFRKNKYKKGSMFRVLGIPRINLSEVLGIARLSKGVPQRIALPYEIIVAAVLDSEE